MLRKHIEKRKNAEIEKSQKHPLTILTNLGAWISRQKVEFNPLDMRITLGDTCIAVVYDSGLPNDMSDEFWENANGCRYIVRMNISILGFDFDDHDEFIGTNHPDCITGADLSLSWSKLVNYIYNEDDEELYDIWNIPFAVLFERGNVSMAGVRIGHHFNNGSVRLIDSEDDMLFIEDATIPKILSSFVELYFPTY